MGSVTRSRRSSTARFAALATPPAGRDTNRRIVVSGRVGLDVAMQGAMIDVRAIDSEVVGGSR